MSDTGTDPMKYDASKANEANRQVRSAKEEIEHRTGREFTTEEFVSLIDDLTDTRFDRPMSNRRLLQETAMRLLVMYLDEPDSKDVADIGSAWRDAKLFVEAQPDE